MRWIPALLLLAACKVPDGSGIDNTDTPEPEPSPNAPTAVEIAIEPTAVDAGVEFGVVILTPATDEDGDEVTYQFAWTTDGAASPIKSQTVPGGTSEYNELWEVTVTPTDGYNLGPPATASIKVGNRGPTAPALSFSSSVPDVRSRLVFDPLVDPDGDVVNSTTTWFQDGIEVPEMADRLAIEAVRAQYGRTFRVEVTVWDEWNPPSTSSAEVRFKYDCDNLPPFNLGDTTLRDARAYHGLAFDDDGTLIGWDQRSALVKSLYRQGFSVFVPGFNSVQQIDRMADGDFAIAENAAGRLTRVTSAGATSPISTAVGNAYGVTVGPDGMIYTADNGVKRTDPSTGRTQQFLEDGCCQTAHSLNFNLDSTRMYIGTIGNGTVYYVDLDEDLNPVGRPRTYANFGGWHDGIEVDECGNIYVADYSTSGFYRVELDGTVTPIVDADSRLYGHGAMYGRGVGGWRTDAIYQPEPYNGNRIREVVIGLGSGDTVRTWNGQPAPW
jgi:hypothetical protein